MPIQLNILTKPKSGMGVCLLDLSVKRTVVEGRGWYHGLFKAQMIIA
jgi:hypothetical protein